MIFLELPGENPEQPVVAADEDEDDDVDASGGGLPVLKWSKGGFKNLMTTVHMADEWEATYPQEGDTGADAPAGYITLWADFFTEGNLRLLVTVFVAEVLEYYHLHISQLSPFGMFRIRNFEYTFRAHVLPITVENFGRFYQLTVNTGFFSFTQRHGSLKLMTPPKGVTHWKMKFFYVKACAVYANMTFRDVNIGVTDEDIPVATAKTVDWFSRLRPIELKKLDNNQLWVLRMMLTRPDRKARPVLREKSGVDAVGLWRMFEPDFKGQVDLIPVELREGFNLEIVGNFRVPKRDVLRAPVPEGEKGPPVVGEKRELEQTAAGGGEPKRRRMQSKRAAPSQKKPAVAAESQDAGFSFFDFPAGVPKEPEVPKEPAAPFDATPDPTVQVEKTVEKTVSQIFDTVDSSNNLISPNEGDGLDLRFSDVGKQKSDAEPRQTDAEPQKSSAGEKVTGSSSSGAGYDGPPIQPGESELEYYYRTYTQDRSTAYHRPPWTVMQGDDISNDPSACREILGGLGTPFETERARAAPRELRINQLSSMLVGSSIVANAILEDYKVLGRREEEAARLRAEAEELVKAARAGAEQLERDRAAFDKQKQTAAWAATAELKQVRTLAKLLSDERKSWNEKFSNERKKWNESWAKQNDNWFRARQELTNAKAANAALGKEKAAAEAAKERESRSSKALEEAKERESRSSKALEEANAEQTRLKQVVSSLQAEVQTREVAVTDLTARMTAAEERANVAVEARDALTSSLQQLEADREWMRSQGIAHIVQAIMDAPETATGLDLVKERARDAGFKAGYSHCIGHINVMSEGGFTEERSWFRDVDTEARLNAAVASFYDTSLSCVEKLVECLEAADYVDRLRMLYADGEEENPAGGSQDGAGTSGTK
uniref:Transposase (Putative), gypsy type n=1 Tax=Helianthus annuus TaxID=4232 RepID=A0A251S928_HELAN